MISRRNITATGLIGVAILLLGRLLCLAETGDQQLPPSGGASLEDNSNPYSVIVQRNVFGLKPPAPAKPADTAPAPVLPKLSLNGFIQTGDKLQVSLGAATLNPDPRGREIISYLTLAVGEKQTVGSGDRQGVIEVLQADADNGTAVINNSGAKVTLSMTNNAQWVAAAQSGNWNPSVVLHSTPAAPPIVSDENAAGNPGVSSISLSSAPTPDTGNPINSAPDYNSPAVAFARLPAATTIPPVEIPSTIAENLPPTSARSNPSSPFPVNNSGQSLSAIPVVNINPNVVLHPTPDPIPDPTYDEATPDPQSPLP